MRGARDLLASLEKAEAPWAMCVITWDTTLVSALTDCSVTSGTRALCTGWLEVMELAHPKHLVVAEDVKEGKPGRAGSSRVCFYVRLFGLILLGADPECYQLGKHRLGLGADANYLVIEDSPAGCKAGKAAGCKVIGLATTHSIDQLRATRPDWIVRDLRSVRLVNDGTALAAAGFKGKVNIEISDALML